MSLSIEDKLVFRCSRINMDKDDKHLLGETIHSDLNWDYILENALDNGVSSLLYQNLKGFAEGGSIPIRVIAKLRDDYFGVAARNLLLREELGKVLKVFADEKILAITLKGMFLLEDIYHDIGLRPIGDIDILVKKEQLPKINWYLKKQGYFSPFRWTDYIDKPDSQYLNSVSYVKGPIHLHIHWHIINVTTAIYLHIGKIKIDRFWQKTRQANIAGVKSLVMAPHHLLVHLCEHSFKHAYDRLILLCDIFETINYYNNKDDLNWELFLEETASFNLNTPVFYSLYFTSKLMKAKIPEDVLNKIRPPHFSYRGKIIEKLVLENKRIPELRCLLPLIAMNENFSQRLRYIWMSFFLPRQIIAQRNALPYSIFPFFHYVLRIKSGFRKGLKVLGYLLQSCHS